jgi:hypothetical protein
MRYPVSRKARWQVMVFQGKSAVRAGVRDISVEGIGLSLEEHLEPGTMLTLEMVNSSRLFFCTRLMRVAHALPQRDGTCLVGCEFSSPLTYEQIYALLCN